MPTMYVSQILSAMHRTENVLIIIRDMLNAEQEQKEVKIFWSSLEERIMRKNEADILLINYLLKRVFTPHDRRLFRKKFSSLRPQVRKIFNGFGLRI